MIGLRCAQKGSESDSFRPSRGIRKSDPLSPYLFVICMERLAQAINRAVNEGYWKPIVLSRNGPKLSHLFFAEASLDQLDVIQRILGGFCESSGHKEDISSGFQFIRVDELGKYLGVPLLYSRATRATYQYIVQRVRDRLAGWRTKTLSFAGRITLAKSVLCAIPSYAMQSCYFPKKVLSNEERSRRHLTNDASCGGAVVESISHILRLCPIAKGVWDGLIPLQRKMVLRCLWKRRNQVVFSSDFQGQESVLVQSTRLFWEARHTLNIRIANCARVGDGVDRSEGWRLERGGESRKKAGLKRNFIIYRVKLYYAPNL
ncbi:uncharacterized protein LOC120153344 [Hibiscus syriacus]|uniref:uncharacterized protein LOC120153344 n=1 Tax=Hibiscus syriacus TaxID=106335 RepID=UPI0019215D57|nr:uncharacterized protein LOC120153344 [Hibiscus syriacus]